MGIEIRIERLEGKWKMGQNRSDEDREGAVEGLLEMKTPSATEVSELMASAGLKPGSSPEGLTPLEQLV